VRVNQSRYIKVENIRQTLISLGVVSSQKWRQTLFVLCWRTPSLINAYYV